MKLLSNRSGRHLGYFDVHVPININFDKVLEFQKTYDPSHIIIGGDFLNLDHASHWNEGIFSKIGFDLVGEALHLELAAGTKLLTRIREASPNSKIFYIPGNHEHWLFWCALYYPQMGILLRKKIDATYKADLAYEGDKALKELLIHYLGTKLLEIEVLPYNEPLEIGKIKYLHGHQLTISNSPRMYPNDNLVFGHWHEHSVKTLNDSGDPDYVCQHTAVPCMTKLGPKAHAYRQGKSSRWLNGFWVADVLANGLFDGHVKKVLGGKVMIP